MAYSFDLHIQPLSIDEQLSTNKLVGFGFTSTVGVKGFQMLINMWLHCFLTAKGSDPANLNYGTTFAILPGSNIDLEDAQDIVNLAVQQCNQQITRIQSNDRTLTSSERLASAKIVNFVEAPSLPGFELYVEIKNASQERLVFNLPALRTA
jgi:hypothetical protein